MTEKRSKAEPEAPVTAGKGDNKTVENPSQSPLKKSGGGKSQWFKVLVILIIVTAVTALGFLGWTQWQKLVAADRVSKAAASFERFYQPIEQIYQQSEKRQSQRIEQLYNQLSNMQLRLNAQGQRLAELVATTSIHWLLSSALYLFLRARQRLQPALIPHNPRALS